MGIHPVHHITNLQTMCLTNFRIWLTFDHKTLDTIVSRTQWLQNKFILLALHLPKYIISAKLLHYSSGLPYVKDRLLSCTTRTLERISKNPLVEESITFNRVNPAWDRFPTPFSVIHPVSLQTNITFRGNFSEHKIASETGSRRIRGSFGTVFRR